MTPLPTQTLNPWLSIWTKPRQTIQQIVDTNPQHLVLLLAGLSGISESLDRASNRNSGDTLSLTIILPIIILIGPISGIIGLYLYGALIKWTGNWLDGKASGEEVRAAIAWATVPLVFTLPLWIPQIALLGQEIFKSQTPLLDSNLSLAIILLALVIIEFLAAVWSFFLLMHCLGQVQGFSAWKALGNAILAGLVIIIPVLVVVGIVFMVT